MINNSLSDLTFSTVKASRSFVYQTKGHQMQRKGMAGPARPAVAAATFVVTVAIVVLACSCALWLCVFSCCLSNVLLVLLSF